MQETPVRFLGQDDPLEIPGSGKSLGEGNGKPLQYSCSENPEQEEPGAWTEPGQRSLVGYSPWGRKESVMT